MESLACQRKTWLGDILSVRAQNVHPVRRDVVGNTLFDWFASKKLEPLLAMASYYLEKWILNDGSIRFCFIISK